MVNAAKWMCFLVVLCGIVYLAASLADRNGKLDACEEALAERKQLASQLSMPPGYELRGTCCVICQQRLLCAPKVDTSCGKCEAVPRGGSREP